MAYAEILDKRIDRLRRLRFSTKCKRIEILAVYKYLANRPKIKGMIEVGSFKGGMLRLLAPFMERGATIASVDLGVTVQGRGKGEKHAVKLRQSIKFLRDQGFDARLFLGRSDKVFGDVARFVKGRVVDLLHIDGGHDYETVKYDYEHYSSLLAAGGAVLMHDVANPACTVPKYWAELSAIAGKQAWIFDPPGAVAPGMGVVEL